MNSPITNRRINWRIAVLLIGLIIVAAFMLLNFRAAISHTSAGNNSVSTSIGMDAGKMPEPMQRREKITLVISGQGRLADALQKSLAAEIREAGLGEVEIERALKPAYPNPVLLVEASDAGILWTPFFAFAQFPLHASYDSNGKTTLSGKAPYIYNSDGPAINMSADYTVSDQSFGLISYPGYHQFLADYLARAIADSTKKLYEPK